MKFLCDAMLARLGRWLRMFGYDTEIADTKESDAELLERACAEKRVFLTQDKSIKGNNVFLIRSRAHVGQLKEVVGHFGIPVLFPEDSRCSACNGALRRLMDKYVCSSCGKLYWEGSHWIRIRKTIKEIAESRY
ncbi:MAG: Mut7-C RNAse domain-containing protein [archaeon]